MVSRSCLGAVVFLVCAAQEQRCSMKLKGGKLKTDKRKCIFKQWKKLWDSFPPYNWQGHEFIGVQKEAGYLCEQWKYPEKLSVRDCFSHVLTKYWFFGLGSPRWSWDWNGGRGPQSYTCMVQILSIRASVPFGHLMLFFSTPGLGGRTAKDSSWSLPASTQF